MYAPIACRTSACSAGRSSALRPPRSLAARSVCSITSWTKVPTCGASKPAAVRSFRAQAVLHEVGEMAAPRLVHARGAERDAAPVERVDGLTREPSARIVRGVAHGGKGLGAAAAPLQITPRFPADVFARIVERTALCCKAVCLVGILRFDLYRRQSVCTRPTTKLGRSSAPALSKRG